MKRILVGVDASPASVEALARAADEARLRDAALEVVYAFDPPEHATAWPVVPEKGADRRDPEQAKREADAHLSEWLRNSAADLDGIDVSWTVVADGRPARALVERSSGADLVVVGSRGRGGFAGLRLGSVSEQVTRHAHCPVLVIRAKE